MKRLFFLFILCSAVALEGAAQEFAFNKGMLKLHYREKAYNPSAAGKSMLVVYLHPRSARGHKNETQTKTPGYKAIDHYLDSIGMKAVLLAPQCEEARHWNEYSSPVGKYFSDVVYDFIDDYANSHNIDKSRIFVLGESFGGSGVWRLVSDYPGYFAAAMPAVCSPKLDRLQRFVKLGKAAKTPLCIVVGERDQIYGPAVMAPYIDTLTKKNCRMKYIILPGMNHQQACLKAYTNEALDWMFKR
ncbi:MAG: hypothetical protein MJZ08_01360 [Bacteroidaceae bacterium]|nr:hypothetical protein [Bacteroidaceae bacterium]